MVWALAKLGVRDRPLMERLSTTLQRPRQGEVHRQLTQGIWLHDARHLCLSMRCYYMPGVGSLRCRD